MVAHRDLDLSQSSQARKLKVKITIECQILVPWVKTPVREFQSDRILCGKKPLGSYTNIHWLIIYEVTTNENCVALHCVNPKLKQDNRYFSQIIWFSDWRFHSEPSCSHWLTSGDCCETPRIRERSPRIFV